MYLGSPHVLKVNKQAPGKDVLRTEGLKEQLETANYNVMRLERELALYKYLHGTLEENKKANSAIDSKDALLQRHQKQNCQLQEYNQQLQKKCNAVHELLRESTRTNCHLEAYCNQLQKCILKSQEENNTLGQSLFKQGFPPHSQQSCNMQRLKGQTILYFGDSWGMLTQYRSQAAKFGVTFRLVSPNSQKTFLSSTKPLQNSFGIICCCKDVPVHSYHQLKILCQNFGKPIALAPDQTVKSLHGALKEIANKSIKAKDRSSLCL